MGVNIWIVSVPFCFFPVSVRLPFECLSNTVQPLPILPIIIYRWGWWGVHVRCFGCLCPKGRRPKGAFARFVVSFMVFSFPVGLFGSVLAPRSSPLLFPGGSRFVLVELVVFP